MKRFARASIISLSLALSGALAGCSGDNEETPDIAEAIPLDPEGAESDDAGADTSDQPGEDASGSDTPDLPGGDSGARNLPDSMESGSNPPGMTEPPSGSKVQPIKG